MFRTLQWKLVCIFMLLVTAVMLIVGTFMLTSTIDFYQREFLSQLTLAFGGELTGQLNIAVSTASDRIERVDRLNTVLSAYSGQLGINSSRHYYILSGTDGSVLSTSNASLARIDKTANILTALSGKTGDKIISNASYMDYAVYLPGSENESGYIIYIKDSKNALKQVTSRMFTIISQSLLFCIFISIILGYFLSKAITVPITKLTNNTRRLAKGEFDIRIDTKAKDEIGELTRTFNYMGLMMKNTLEQVSGEKNKVEIILQNLTNGVIAFDADQNVIHSNHTAIQMLGIDHEKPVMFDEFFASLGVNICMAEFLYLEHYRTVERDIISNGKHIIGYFVPFKMENEKTIGVVVLFHDMTEQFALDDSRREFVANVSHELRTPLTTIKTYAETLLNGASDDQQTTNQFIKIIDTEADRMARIVKDLLTLSSLDYKKSEWVKTYFPLEDLLKSIVLKFSVEAKNKNQNLNYSPTTKIPNIYADKDKIEQVIINIISNAMKYTPEGGKIDVYAGHLYNEVYIKIRDTGIGIPQKDLPHIFDRFYRVDKARARSKGGTGLGLAIAREIVENHGGSIKIDSDYGKFTEVIINLPAH